MGDLKRLEGSVSRWGTKGYGFIHSDEVPKEIWFHIKFLVDADYQPARGDVVAFTLKQDPAGGYQAHEVALLRPNPEVLRLPASQRVWTNPPRITGAMNGAGSRPGGSTPSTASVRSVP